jgi:hypothetical protein
VQLSSRSTGPAPTDLAAALRGAATALGHRPAISALTPTGRQEQSFASLAQWAAKTAHWLTLEHLLEPRARVGIVGPPGWVPAAAALGAWWLGCTVVGEADADVVVAHAAHVPTGAGELVTWGWDFDGTAGAADPDGFEPFAHAVQPFPDQPPAPTATAEALALVTPAVAETQRELLDRWDATVTTPVGVGPDAPLAAWLPAVAVRPLVVGRPTVVLAAGVDPTAASGDRVAEWLG